MNISPFVITVMSGVEDGKEFKFNETPIVLGRHPEDDLCLPYDTRVSRRHARITREQDSYFVEDVGPESKGSTNGTYVNEQKIAMKTPLSSGDIFLLGTVWLLFEETEISNRAFSSE